jgi:hypothetical protein
VRVAIGEISAVCSKCFAEQFDPVARSGQLMREKRYRCVVCHSEFEYGELLLQIGERTIAKVKAGRETRKP